MYYRDYNITSDKSGPDPWSVKHVMIHLMVSSRLLFGKLRWIKFIPKETVCKQSWYKIHGYETSVRSIICSMLYTVFSMCI